MFTKRKSDPKQHPRLLAKKVGPGTLYCRGLNLCGATDDLYDLELVTASVPVSLCLELKVIRFIMGL